MLAQIITENGQKKIQPLTADIGSGNPIGTILPLYKKSTPNGYLYCDGSTFDTTAYPGLYAYLGTNVLPDYREFALVGAEENTTDVYNATTNPNGTIHDHDVYTEGEAKDDQLQSHTHSLYIRATVGNPSTDQNVASGDYTQGTYRNDTGQIMYARQGDVTRGKRKAVYFYIKATTGLDENQQDYVLETLNNTLIQQRSYSTDEHLTGKKWIDGKPIYSKTFTTTVAISQDYSWGGLQTEIANLNLQNSVFAQATGPAGETFPIVFVPSSGFKCFALTGLGIGGNITIEYTKTTD